MNEALMPPFAEVDLDAAVRAAREKYAAARPLSREWAERARAVLPGATTRSVLDVDPFPIRVARAAGAWLWDVDGHRDVDLLGDYTSGLLGHSPAPEWRRPAERSKLVGRSAPSIATRCAWPRRSSSASRRSSRSASPTRARRPT